MLGVFLELSYTTSKLQSLFGGKDQNQRSQIALKQKEKSKKKYYKYLGSEFWLWPKVKNYGLLGRIKLEDR